MHRWQTFANRTSAFLMMISRAEALGLGLVWTPATVIYHVLARVFQVPCSLLRLLGAHQGGFSRASFRIQSCSVHGGLMQRHTSMAMASAGSGEAFSAPMLVRLLA